MNTDKSVLPKEKSVFRNLIIEEVPSLIKLIHFLNLAHLNYQIKPTLKKLVVLYEKNEQ